MMRRTSTMTLCLLLLFSISALLLNGCGGAEMKSADDNSAGEAGLYTQDRKLSPGSSANAGAAEVAPMPYRGPELMPDELQKSDYLAASQSGALPGLQEEVWIISRGSAKGVDRRHVEDDSPGSGAMVWQRGDGAEPLPIPLKHTAVKAYIHSYIATVDVKQQFHNPYSEKIEAVYVFPLPSNAAVTDFVMTIGERRIRGIIRDREEAERIYKHARSQGYRASLMTQERPNIFTQKVANIEPGKQIDVDIRYFHTLAQVDGDYELVFPMVIGPRFNPPSHRQGIGASLYGSRESSGQPTEVSYVRPHERPGNTVSLEVEVDAGLPIERIESLHHKVEVSNNRRGYATVRLTNRDTLLNRDFVLRYRLAGEELRHRLVVQKQLRRPGEDRASNDSYFTMMIMPPRISDRLARQPMEMILVLDTSGSMDGEPMRLARDAARQALKHLGARDTFQIIRFSNDTSKFGRTPVPATQGNVERGLDYLDNLEAGGGTMMERGISTALSFPHDDKKLRVVAFLTDGFIGNETDVLSVIDKHLGATRIFSFGIGSSPNRYLMERMAKLGRGAVAYVTPGDNSKEVMDTFMSRAMRPALADIQIDWNGLDVVDVYPKRLPDVFVGRPVTIAGRIRGDIDDASASIRVSGMVGGERITFNVPVEAARASGKADLAKVYARMKIADLYDSALLRGNRVDARDIRDLAKHHALMSPYTAFVAVDSSRRTEGSYGVTVPVPVPTPEGMRYDTAERD